MALSKELNYSPVSPAFDVAESKARCRRMRRRILDLSQRLPALHVAPAFSCLEIVDTIYHGLMNNAGAAEEDRDAVHAVAVAHPHSLTVTPDACSRSPIDRECPRIPSGGVGSA